MRRTCAQPDRDEPRLTCGYPLPCPHHTLIVDATIVDDLDVARDAFIDGRVDDAKRIMNDALKKKVR